MGRRAFLGAIGLAGAAGLSLADAAPAHALSEQYWRDFWGNPNHRGNPFGHVPGWGYHNDFHRGVDISPGGTVDVPVLRPGIARRLKRWSAVGWEISVEVGPGDFDIYCHLYQQGAVAAGTYVNAGDRIGRLAGHGEDHGDSWGGPHLHFVNSDHVDGANRVYVARNPNPIITATLAGTTPPTAGTPWVPVPPTPKIGLNHVFLCTTPINNVDASAGIYRWIIDPAAGTKRNIDAAEYDYLKSVGYTEVGGLQSPAVSWRYQQVYPAPSQP
jgi:hypothetical protein